MNTNLAYQDDYGREELIGGEVVMMSPASTNHNRIAGDIFKIFSIYLEGRTCEPFSDGMDVYLTEEDHFIPDMMVVCDPEKVQWNGVFGAPDLVVEVLSPSTGRTDRGRTMRVYGQCGVREYWIVSPNERSVEQYFLQDGQLVLNDIYTLLPDYMLESMKDEERAQVVTEFKCSLFDDLVISLEDVFARVK